MGIRNFKQVPTVIGMVQVDLSSLFAAPVNELTPQEKEDFYETIVSVDLEPDFPPDKLHSLFRISQEVLKYKADQVVSLLADLEILETSHGNGGLDEIREELAKTVRQTEHLEEELQNKERELTIEKTHVEKLLSEVSDLKKEKNELRREIFLIQQERQTAFAPGDGEDSADVDHLKDTIQSKNKHILQLLSDIECLEKENEVLRLKVSSVRQEITEATTNLTKFSGENISLRQSCYELQEKVTQLEERNAGLVSQVSELVTERKDKDAQLDELIDALEARVAKWQEILSYKDSELAELRTRLNEAHSSSVPMSYNSTNYLILTQSLEKQEEKIEELQDQLAQATEDLTRSTELLQEFKKKAESRESGEGSLSNAEVLREDLEKAYARISFLEDKLNDAEQDAQARAEETTELIIQLREYEDGVYGLKEARSEIKDLKMQVKARDKQILKLVEQTNKLHLKSSSETLGESYQLDEEESDINNIASTELRTQLHQYQQTAINLSMQNYDLRAEVIKLKNELEKINGANEEQEVIDSGRPATDNMKSETKEECLECKELNENLVQVINENEGLRKGLHEILDSVHNHDGTSNVAIESECLESLLAALDSRHLSGWYHPAMRLQVDVNKLEGNNSALRNQLRETRLRESYFQAELQVALLRIGELETLLAEKLNKDAPIPRPRHSASKKVLINGDTVENTEEIEKEEKIQDDIGECVNGKDEPQNGHMSENNNDENHSNGNKSVTSQSTVEKGEEKNEKILDSLNEETTPTTKEAMVQHEIDHEEKSTQTELMETVLPPNVPETLTSVGKLIQEGMKPTVESQDNSILKTNGKDHSETDSLLNKFSEIEQNENELREQCNLLKQELENIRSSTEKTLNQLNENKDTLVAEVSGMMKKVEEQLTNITSNSKAQATNELVVTAFQAQESKLTRYESELIEVRKVLSDKESLLTLAENQIKDLKQQLEGAVNAKEAHVDTHVKALKTTLQSLQEIIAQKEESINRHQKLLKDRSDEYEKLMDKYIKLEEKSPKVIQPREKITDSKAITILMEKWLTKVHSLEDQIRQLTHRLSEAEANVIESQKEIDNWKEIATKAGEKLSDEAEELLKEKIKENDELRNTLRQQKVDSDNLLREKLRSEHIKLRKKEEEFKAKVREYENEISKLKNHLSTRSTRTRSTNSAKKECLLLDRIKTLEEELEEYKNREQNNLQMRRDKCAEEFTKWDEKKRLQSANEKLKIELKERLIQTDTLETQISRLKQIISRMERERISLQRRLKSSEDIVAKNLVVSQSRESQIDPEDNELTDGRGGPSAVTPRSGAESVGDESMNEEAKTKGRSKRDLEKAIVALRKVVAKLRAENSRIPHKGYIEHLQKELQKTQENYVDAVEKTLFLEEKLKEAESRLSNINRQTYIVDAGGDRSEVTHLREQLTQKCELLSRVKVLLQRAMAREKELVNEVSYLRKLLPQDQLINNYDIREP